MPVSGPQKTAADLDLAEICDATYVFQKYHPKETVDAAFTQVNPPKLKGLSGGVTLDLGHPLDSDISSGAKPTRIHSVGICTKYDSSLRVIQSTRPGHFIREVVESGSFPLPTDGQFEPNPT